MHFFIVPLRIKKDHRKIIIFFNSKKTRCHFTAHQGRGGGTPPEKILAGGLPGDPPITPIPKTALPAPYPGCPPQGSAIGRWLMPVNGFESHCHSPRLPENGHIIGPREAVYGRGAVLHKIQNHKSPDWQTGAVMGPDSQVTETLAGPCLAEGWYRRLPS
jgi:hypothetical protein